MSPISRWRIAPKEALCAREKDAVPDHLEHANMAARRGRIRRRTSLPEKLESRHPQEAESARSCKIHLPPWPARSSTPNAPRVATLLLLATSAGGEKQSITTHHNPVARRGGPRILRMGIQNYSNKI
jgi:hypothetical protein